MYGSAYKIHVVILQVILRLIQDQTLSPEQGLLGDSFCSSGWADLNRNTIIIKGR